MSAFLLYLSAVHRLSTRGRSWPRRRTAAYLAGLVAIAVATQPPLEAQDTRLFSAHIVQHLLLSMVGAPLLCLGVPITLWLQAAQRQTQTRLLAVLHSPPVRFITFPLVSWLIFIGTLFVLYFSPLYPLTLRNRFFHELVHLHFVAAGFLFFSLVVAIDPHPWRMPHGARLLYVGLTLPAHAFLALALLSASTPVAADWYMQTTGHDLAQVLQDQKLGAAIMWIAGDLIAISTVAVVVTQWTRDDERAAAREDRYVDLSRTTADASLSGRSPSNLG